MTRPETTLFMLMSLDGKISSGDQDCLDPDRDWAHLPGVGEGLPQYYALEQETELWSFNSGRVMAKVGMNDRREPPKKSPVSFALWDNKPHLTPSGIAYLCDWLKQVVIFTTNPRHPALALGRDNLSVVVQPAPSLPDALETLACRFGVQRLTVQSGGRLNGLFLRQRLLDHVDLVVAPLLVGGGTTPTLIDGEAVHAPAELDKLAPLTLEDCQVLEHSYLRLRYRVLPY